MSHYTEWLRLRFYLEHELSEGEITLQTYECLTKALDTLHPKGDNNV